MRRKNLITCLMLSSLLAFPTCKHKDEYPIWEDPRISNINTIHPHALLIPYQEEKKAIKNNPALSKYYLSLNGIWKFKWMAKSEKASRNFYKTNYDVSKWDEVEVPSTWPFIGYDNHTERPSNPPMINTDNPVGSYHTLFTIPDGWKGKNVILRFEGVQSALQVWINGQEAGYNEGSATPAEFNITPYLHEGENILAARVFQWTDNSYLEENELSRFCGIYRDVFLYALPNIHIKDVQVVTDFDEAYKNVELKLKLSLSNMSHKPQKVKKILVKLRDQNSKLVMKKDIPVNEPIESLQEQEFLFRELIEGPNPWSDETPYLYTLTISLYRNDSITDEIICQQIGFREMEMKNGQLLLNGRPIKFRGTNYAEFDPGKGKVISYEAMVNDILLMKRNNINAVITLYGPHHPHWYDLCDEYGIYVWDEMNLQTTNTQFAQKPEWKKSIMNKGMAMIHRDKNHPGVVVWSLGKKAGTGDNINALAEAIKLADPTRPIHYGDISSTKTSKPKLTDFDIISNKYILPSELQLLHDSFPERPVIICKYMDTRGNSTGGLMDYWSIINENPRMQGGFISNWAMLGIKEMNEDSVTYFKPLSSQDNDMVPFSGLVYPDRKPTPAINEVKYVYQPVIFKPVGLYNGRISITNKHAFTNLKYYDATWEIEKDGKRVFGGKIYNLDIAPGETKIITLPYSSFTAAPGKEYFLTISLTLPDDNAWAEKGYEVAWAQFKLPFYSPRPDALPLTYMKEMEVSESNESITLQNSDWSVTISKENGSIVSYRYQGKDLLMNGPELNFWRSPTYMDQLESKKLPLWKAEGLDSVIPLVQSVSVEKMNSKMTRIYFLKTYHNAENNKLFDGKLAYTVYGNGAIEIVVKIVPTNYIETMAKAGLRFNLPPSMNTITWFGKGPYETYPDRAAAKVSVYGSQVGDLFEHYLVPQENGNRCDVRWIALTDTANAGLFINSASLFNMSFSTYPDDPMEYAWYDHKLSRSTNIRLNIDFRQTGIGKSLHREGEKSPYMVYAEEMDFTLILRPFSPANTNLLYLSATRLPSIEVNYPEPAMEKVE